MDAPSPLILKEALHRCKRAFIYVALFSLAANIMMLFLPLYSLQVLDRVMSSHSMETLVLLTLITLIGFTFYGAFTGIRGFILTAIGDWLDSRLGPQLLANSVVRASMGASVGAGQSQRDLANVKAFVSGQGITTLFDAPWSVIFVLIIYAIHPVLGFLSVGGAAILLGFAVLTEFATKKPINMAQAVSIRSGSMAEVAGRNAEAIEAMGMLPNVTRNWAMHTKRSLELQHIAGARSNLIQSASRVIRMALQISVTAIGAYFVIKAEMTIGGMIAAGILVSRALAPFEAAIGVWKMWVTARDSYHRLTQSLSGAQQLRGTIDLPPPQGELVVENVFYRPPNSEKPIIKAASFQLNPGESLGIIGPSAAGKSTLAKLIIGVLPPTHGSVRLDGAEIFKWNRESLGPHVGYMPQDVELFGGTIKDNIARMDTQAPAQAVIEAAQAAGVHEMILRLPKGYETEYTFGNMALSPGQKQRIGLARALYGNPRFLVLDEPNLNLDGEGEKALVQALADLKARGLTFIVVAHRPSVVGSVDKILMLRDGVIEQFGPRDQVLQKYITRAPVANLVQGGAG